MGRVYRLLTRVTAVGPDWVQIERPLTANVSLEWAPRFHEFQPQISSSGIEDLTIRFKWAPYKGHLQVGGGGVGGGVGSVGVRYQHCEMASAYVVTIVRCSSAMPTP